MAPFRIESVRLREIRLPLREPFVISSGSMDDRRILLVEIVDGDGFRAWSECVASARPNYSPETIDTAWLALESWLVPAFVGREFEGPRAVGPHLARGIKGHRMARAALEMGSWCLAAEREGSSLAALLGGTRDQVETGISLGLQESTGALVERAREAVDAGYRKVKLKIAPGADVEVVEAVREALGPDATLAVDANAAYTLEDADHLARLDRFGLLMIEQPLAVGDLLRHARLQARLATPLCLDESIVDAASAEDMIELGSGRIINIKAGRVGGLLEAVRIHDVAERAGVPVWCGGMLESGIGRAYNVALASLANFRLPGDVSPSARYWERDIVVPEWTMSREGRVRVPRDRSGLGVDVDVDRVEDLTVRAASFPAPAVPA